MLLELTLFLQADIQARLSSYAAYTAWSKVSSQFVPTTQCHSSEKRRHQTTSHMNMIKTEQHRGLIMTWVKIKRNAYFRAFVNYYSESARLNEQAR